MLQLLVWGTFTTEEKYLEIEGRDKSFPPIPGMFALQTPYENTVLAVSENCPARYVNDARDIPEARNNIKFVQHDNPRDLFHDKMKGLHLFLQAQVIEVINEGDQLFCDYGDEFWSGGPGSAPIGKQGIDEEALLVPDEKNATVEDPDENVLVPIDVDDDEIPGKEENTSSKTTTKTKQKPKLASALSQPNFDSDISDKELEDAPIPSQGKSKKTTSMSSQEGKQETKSSKKRKPTEAKHRQVVVEDEDDDDPIRTPTQVQKLKLNRKSGSLDDLDEVERKLANKGYYTHDISHLSK